MICLSVTDGESDKEVLWNEYLAGRREQYWASRRNTLGAEYDTQKQRWDAIIEREWLIFSETLRGGDDVSIAIRQQMGDDFFTRQLTEDPIDYDFEKFQVGRQTLTLYHIEDFIMLANQGIFRDVVFLIDKGRRWEKKVLKGLIENYSIRIKVDWHPDKQMSLSQYENMVKGYVQKYIKRERVREVERGYFKVQIYLYSRTGHGYY